MRYHPDEIFKVRFKNTNKFREAAIRFEDNGCYTFAPRGTSEYREYWDRERDRCLYGYNIGDNYISGYNYFYLNYSRIVRVTEKTVNGRLFVDREETFPNFWDGDWQYYMAIDIAEELGKHLAVVKTRGRGYSYKAASMLNRNFFLIPQSKGYAIASNQDFLIKDGLLTKSWDMMSFLDEHTAWSKRKHKVDTMMHKRASFIETVDSKQVEKGYKSEIIGVTMANDPNKARGKRGKLVLYEESGDNNDLLAAWQINRPSVEQGVKTFGLMIAFGTGGSEGAKYEGLKELFYNPKAYNILEFNNIWDAGAAKKCSFFMPEYMNFEGLMDSDGNSDTEAALKVSSEERMKVKEHAKNRHSYDRYIAEHPFCPMEAMLKLRGNIFPSNDLIEHLAFLESDPVAKNYGEIGKLTFHEGGKLQWIRQDGGLYIRDYPVRHDESAEASIMIWEHPDPNPPRGVYVSGLDPFDHDQSGSGSLGSMFIFKRFQGLDKYYDVPVAEYTARPDAGADAFYENARRLLLYYNATCLYENNLKGLHTYFKNKRSDYLLADQPTFLKDITSGKAVNRGKGIHMAENIKRTLEGWLRDWLVEEYEEGKFNLQKIMSPALVKELIAYNPDGNFDRVIAFMLCIGMNKEYCNLRIIDSNKQYFGGYFNKPMFKNKIYQSTFIE